MTVNSVRSGPAGRALAVVLSLLTVFGPISMDLYLPVLPALTRRLRYYGQLASGLGAGVAPLVIVTLTAAGLAVLAYAGTVHRPVTTDRAVDGHVAAGSQHPVLVPARG